ncbi:MAG: glycoside hydrolase family 71/99-like protein [Candidatus Delongbacteria bacterium]|jgi:glycoprotein endo-alpha-1,2-mannosidase|nr:glycoside hydrolase family 71/99-like protein [Candidatus Delongbacteria bacterium]
MKIKTSHLLSAISLLIALGITSCSTGNKNTNENVSKTPSFEKHTMSPGLIMAGYQGWFNTPGDGAERGWYHLKKGRRFEPGACTIDMWPDMTEYEKQYETAFNYSDGSAATIFSSHDESTVNLHFKWMKDYGIDGVFMQRFVGEVKRESGRNHFNKVLTSASKAALEYDRTIAVMYDMSGMSSEDVNVIIEDWKKLKDNYGFTKRSTYSNYLFNEGKPLVAIWGVGFNDNRKYNLDDIEKIIRFLKSEEGGSCSVLLGVPTYWREQGNDCIKDEKMHEIIQMADVVHPWFVGRFNENRYANFKPLIGKDKAWCDEHNLKYMPVVFPGFSWYNMYPDAKSSIDRNSGSFFWKQLSGATSEGAEMIYLAMFDEIDEATAIFKLAKRVPVGESKFVPVDEDIPSDHYLWLSGQAGQMMKNKQALPIEKPVQNEN